MWKVCEPFWNAASLVCDGAPGKKGSRTYAFPMNCIHHTYHHWMHWLSSLQNFFYVCVVLSKNKTWCFFFARKAADEGWEVVCAHSGVLQRPKIGCPDLPKWGIRACWFAFFWFFHFFWHIFDILCPRWDADICISSLMRPEILQFPVQLILFWGEFLPPVEGFIPPPEE